MKKVILVTLMLLTVCSYAQYGIGEVVKPSDNIYWTITGPDGHPEVGNSSNLFTVTDAGKAVLFFFGYYG